MKHLIIGTAGHVDHGKTSLIQALTGTNTDRLKEEQERGMTIDLGFALLRLPDGTVAGVVDVPGHERFLKNMLAGASGVDVVLLVIAADEGVMPQTEEHLNILRLLDVRNGIVALTKMDLVDKEWTDIVEEDIRARLKDSFLADSPIIRVSSVTGKGIEPLRKALMAALSRAESRNTALPYRLPVDRVFTKPGFGTVVTGTLVSGTIRVGDPVDILPSELRTRVRGLQVHGKKVTEADAGTRVAVNLASVETQHVERGAQIAYPGTITPTSSFNASMRLLDVAPKAVEDRERVRVHIGTAEIIGRVRILEDREELREGASGFIQFIGETEFVCARGDRFVVRTYSPMHVVGGGIVLDAHPTHHRKHDPQTIAALRALEAGSPTDLIETVLRRNPAGILRSELAGTVGLPPSLVDATVDQLGQVGTTKLLPHDRLILASMEILFRQRALAALDAFHTQFPLRAGMAREELRAALAAELNPKSFNSLMAHWHHENLIASNGALVRTHDFQVKLTDKQQNLLERIEEIYRLYGIAIPSPNDVARELHTGVEAVNALLRVGTERKRFEQLEEGVYLHVQTIEQLHSTINNYIQEHNQISVAEFRDITQSNRKYALQVLEYFDQTRFTRRVGDSRVLY